MLFHGYKMQDLLYYFPEGHQEHKSQGHLEGPERVDVLKQALERTGWWAPYPKVNPIIVPSSVMYSVHHPDYLKFLSNAGNNHQWLDQDTYITPSTYNLAVNTAGGSAALSESVWKRNSRYGFALNRPPGHHACPKRAMGFCFINHIAVSAEYLIQKYRAKKLAIIDLDLHHGNGTQEIFWEREDVFYISLHQSPLFPQSGELSEIGEGKGLRKTANFPLPPGSGDQAYQTIFDELIFLLLEDFMPEMVLVSFGSDPHWKDPLGHLLLSAGVLNRISSQLVNWVDKYAKGRIAVYLEGGYDLDSLIACSHAIIASLLKKKFIDPLGPSPRVEGNSWKGMFETAKYLWK
jgi:acetoin utilization deacetylase AcuC-like enzyme